MKAAACTVLALAVVAALPVMAWAQPGTCPRTMNEPSTLPSLAARRVLDMLPAASPYPLLLQVGEGLLAEPAGKALRLALSCDKRIVFSTVVHRALAPVPDSSTAGGHVNAVADTVQPQPLLVLRVSESAGTLYIAARQPGDDPLGPPDAGWLWVLQRP
jgi:hypothetical protein